VEGENGYTCTQGGDCHLIVVDTSTNKLFELWQATNGQGKWSATQETVWDLTKHYGPEGRGYGCTSADAAGLAILPGLIRPDEVASGEMKHAMRFILPGSKIMKNGYVAPGTHSTSAYSGKMPMATRLRLKATFDETTLPSTGAKVVARAMKKYGMLLADAGLDALTAESDQFTTAKWNGLLGASDLSSLQVSDFEVVDFGSVKAPSSMDCTRAP
jgi:serine/threonine-protein kinase